MQSESVLSQITEPSTMLTDYILGVFALIFFISLLRKKPAQKSRYLWALGFLFTFFASIFGGTHHGFLNILNEDVHFFLWKGTVYSIGLTSLFLLSGTAFSTLLPNWRRVVLVLALIKFIVYAAWMLHHDRFLFVIMDYAPTMLVILGLQIYLCLRFKAESAKWLISGILVSFIAAGVQMSGWGLHTHFNHNDIYHTIQLLGLYMFYRGSLLLRDRV